MKKNNIMWIYMLHIGMNFWEEHHEEIPYGDGCGCGAESFLRCDDDVWKRVTEFAAGNEVDAVLMDLGEGIRYQSHPELAVKGSWDTERLKKEISRLKDMGITPIPKLNFSAAHDEWLGEYSHMLSTQKYYDVCKDLIEEVAYIFDNPPMFHLGMDEETYQNQQTYKYVTVRQGEQWWKDLYKNIEILERLNIRPWIWADYIWHHEEEFLRKMPKTVMLSNWYYDNHFGDYEADPDHRMWVRPYSLLDENGYDQIPAASTWLKDNCMEQTVRYCNEKISGEHLKGFLQTLWKPTLPMYEHSHYAAISLMKYAAQNNGNIQSDSNR